MTHFRQPPESNLELDFDYAWTDVVAADGKTFSATVIRPYLVSNQGEQPRVSRQKLFRLDCAFGDEFLQTGGVCVLIPPHIFSGLPTFKSKLYDHPSVEWIAGVCSRDLRTFVVVQSKVPSPSVAQLLTLKLT